MVNLKCPFCRVKGYRYEQQYARNAGLFRCPECRFIYDAESRLDIIRERRTKAAKKALLR